MHPGERCSQCGGAVLTDHCGNPQCKWKRCSSCRSLGDPVIRMVKPQGGM